MICVAVTAAVEVCVIQRGAGAVDEENTGSAITTRVVLLRVDRGDLSDGTIRCDGERVNVDRVSKKKYFAFTAMFAMYPVRKGEPNTGVRLPSEAAAKAFVFWLLLDR